MSLIARAISFLLGLLKIEVEKPIQQTGLVLDDPSSLEKLPQHELFAGGGEVKDWRPFCPPFRYQGSSYWCTAFAGAAVASIFDKIERGGVTLFSPLELFYRSNGQVFGNYILATLNAMRQSVVLERDLPTPLLTAWNSNICEEWRDKAKVPENVIDFGKQFAIKEPALVRTDLASLKQALSVSPLIISIGIGRGYFNDPAPRQTSYSAYHAVVLTYIDALDRFHIFDSLTQKQGFSGHHTLASDYEILSAFSMIDLPNDWQQKQNNANAHTGAFALNHYGKTRNLKAEQDAAVALKDALKKNPTIQGLMGREWTVCTNAVAYGGYSVQDLLNHYTSIRRGKGPIWNLNELRVK